jgi:hypothetical protein
MGLHELRNQIASLNVLSLKILCVSTSDTDAALELLMLESSCDLSSRPCQHLRHINCGAFELPSRAKGRVALVLGPLTLSCVENCFCVR